MQTLILSQVQWAKNLHSWQPINKLVLNRLQEMQLPGLANGYLNGVIFYVAPKDVEN